MVLSKREGNVPESSLPTRRKFVTGSLAAVGGVALAAAGCTSSSTPASTSSTGSSSSKKQGGTLIVGSLGASTDSIDPNTEISNIDLQRCFNLYDTLTYFPHDALNIQYGLAESIELTQGASVATIRVRDGVTWHNGKSLTADDIMYTFSRILNPKSPGVAAHSIGSVNPNAMKKLDQLTVQLTLNYPDAIFPERFYIPQTSIVPEGYDPTSPVGTGPFKFQSFTPGVRSTFVRNPDYWMSGEPHLDQLVIVDFSDNTSQINALLSGQVDAIDSVPLNNTTTISGRSNLALLTANGGYYQPIVMRVDIPPFNDVRIRQAMRLLVDRPQMVSLCYNNYGSIGNDMPCPSDPAYPHSLPQRTQDVAQAKSLLKAAGQSDLHFTFTTADEDYGLIPGAQVFVQNAQAAGVTVDLNVIPASVYDPKFTDWDFTQSYYGNKPAGIMIALRYIKGGLFNDTRWDDPATTALYFDALKTSDVAARNEKFQSILTTMYDTGPEIIHSFRKTVDAYSTKFSGFTPDQATGWSLGQYRYKEVWSV
jgi:peptide/nickel transport system substrate-binding protein